VSGPDPEPAPDGSAGWGPPPRRLLPLRWGLPDVAIAWVAGIVGSAVVAAIVIGALGIDSDDVDDHIGLLLAGLAAQNVAIIGVLALVGRLKGRGGLVRDFGLRLHLRDWWWVPAGVGLAILAGLLSAPLSELYGHDEAQGVVEALDDAAGLDLALFAISVVTMAPLAEELLFRGALLRALQRRTTNGKAVFWQAAIFALVHPLGDPSVGSLIALPSLFFLGLFAGRLAVERRDLSAPIYLHAGFNLLAAIGAIAS
jgi:uncharacterized protein